MVTVLTEVEQNHGSAQQTCHHQRRDELESHYSLPILTLLVSVSNFQNYWWGENKPPFHAQVNLL